jgi:hypothetical protein
MGQNVEDFKGLMKDLSDSAKTPASMGKLLADSVDTLKGEGTHCWDFLTEKLSGVSENFSVKDVHYEIDSLVVLYDCKYDMRVYSVRITPEGK